MFELSFSLVLPPNKYFWFRPLGYEYYKLSRQAINQVGSLLNLQLFTLIQDTGNLNKKSFLSRNLTMRINYLSDQSS